MSEKISALITRMREIEAELHLELEQRGEKVREGLQHMDKEVVRRQKLLKTNVFRYVSQANILFIITAPVIYSLVVPFALLDLMVTIYQHICFRVYKIPLVRRSEYFSYDRTKLNYLNVIEKLNCAYCSYGNGTIAYAREIASRTEKFWCPIKHAQRIEGTHKYYAMFEEYGDGESYQPNLNKHRATLNKSENNLE
ncbi:MAG: hypothetical protein L3J13_00680 [Devosiaceae bacterium]|nr:hypothetical protein [Devosiaceae bacterium]